MNDRLALLSLAEVGRGSRRRPCRAPRPGWNGNSRGALRAGTTRPPSQRGLLSAPPSPGWRSSRREASSLTLVSEELGQRSFGAATPRLVLDPIDGSMNAKRGVPFFSVSLAVADGPAMADVFLWLCVRLRHARGMGGPSRRGRVSRRRAALGPGPQGRCSRSCPSRRRGRTRSPTRSATWSASLPARG